MYTNMLNGQSSSDDIGTMLCFDLGLLENGRANEALDLFRRMSLPPNEYILSTVFKICTQLGDVSSFEYGQNVFKTMSKTCRNDPIVQNSALKMFLKSGDILTSEEIFSTMSRKSLVTCSIMMNGEKIDLVRKKKEITESSFDFD